MIMFIVSSSAVMVIHCCIWFEQKKVSYEGLLGGGGILQYLYLNVYAEFDSKISYIMFLSCLYDYQLACEISMVRTFALSLANSMITCYMYR